MSEKETAGRLRPLWERWIYSTCLCFALDLEEQKKSTFQYRYSVFQVEYSRNLWFRSGRQMEEIFQAWIDRTRAPLDLDRIKTIFGDKHHPHRNTRQKNPTRWGVVVERPTYDLTVFQVHYGKMSLKIYTKGERAQRAPLRIEVIVHHTSAYRWGRSLPCFGGNRDAPARDSGAIPERGRMPGRLPSGRHLPLPQWGRPKWAESISTSPECGGSLSTAPTGFTASELAEKVRAMSGEAESAYGPRRAAYDLKKLRGKGMVHKIGTSRRYEPEPTGLRAMAALVVLREKVLRPLFAASQRPEPQTKGNHPTPVDQHYEHLRVGMRDLFTTLGIAA